MIEIPVSGNFTLLLSLEALTVIFVLLCAYAGLKNLGIFEKFKEKKIFKSKESSKVEIKPTMTEIFAASQTKYHALLILYVLTAVLGVLVIMQVFPWQAALAMTVILTFLSDRKNFARINYIVLLAAWLIIEVIIAIVK